MKLFCNGFLLTTMTQLWSFLYEEPYYSFTSRMNGLGSCEDSTFPTVIPTLR